MVHQNVLREGKYVFCAIDFKFALTLALKKRRSKLPTLLHTCAPNSELPSNVSTMQQLLRLYQNI